MSAVTGGILNPYISYIHNIFNMRYIAVMMVYSENT
jgi:hypothetical protein